MNIDACRFGYGDPCWVGPQSDQSHQWDNDRYKDGDGRDTGPSTIGWGKSAAMNGFELQSHSSGRWPANIYQCAKASRGEREEGLEDHESRIPPAVEHQKNTKPNKWKEGIKNPRAGAGRTASEVKNFHPTVKPVKLMGWLVRLVTPIDGIVVDTFCGSGTTLVATELEGKYQGIGIEMNPEYCDIIYGRVKHASKKEK